jgi:uncharacterized protein (TIGR02118 family)
MYKLIALFRTPPDPAAFDRHYREVHAPLARLIPGLVRLVVNRPVPAPWGGEPPYYQISELHFEDRDAFEAALASPENRAAARDLREFARDLATFATVSDS